MMMRREQTVQQGCVLMKLARSEDLGRGNLAAALPCITATAAATLDVARSSVWLYNEDHSAIRCVDLYDRRQQRHEQGYLLHRSKYPSYFEALGVERTIAVSDAREDPRTCEFSDGYLIPLGITSMLDAPIFVGSQMVGVVCNEYVGPMRTWMLDEELFAASIADIVALALEAAERKRAQDALSETLAQLELRVQERTAELCATNTQLEIERAKAERLLLNILPATIAERLKASESTIADYFAEATVLFADLSGFTRLAERVSPTQLVEWLNRMFSEFDLLCEGYQLEKIKTIGDAYMAVGGLPMPRIDHAEAMAKLALDMQQVARQVSLDSGEDLTLRIGIHTGPVVAGVIGKRKFVYDLWGDTVNTASRMESHGLPGRIQVTECTYRLLLERYRFEPREPIQVKGKGLMRTYFLVEPAERQCM